MARARKAAPPATDTGFSYVTAECDGQIITDDGVMNYSAGFQIVTDNGMVSAMPPERFAEAYPEAE